MIDNGKVQKYTERFKLFHPANLQREIDCYGYSFSMGKYGVFLLLAVASAIGCGMLSSVLPAVVFYDIGDACMCDDASISNSGWI